MPPDPQLPTDPNRAPADGAPPAAALPVFGAVPPALAAESKPQSSSMRQLLAGLLSLCLGLFLADGVISLIDDSLIVVSGLHLLTGLRATVSLFAMLMALLTYGLMGLTPLIPKRLFLPLALYYPVTQLGLIPFAIYCYTKLALVVWCVSLGQVLLGLGLLFQLQGRLKLRWALVPVNQLNARRFSWRNLSVFVLVNAFALLPAVLL